MAGLNAERTAAMQYGMPTLIENHTLEENAALCGELGLRFIELNMNFPEYQAERLERTEELIRIAERHRLYYTIHLDENLNIADFNPLVSQAYLETVRRTVSRYACFTNGLKSAMFRFSSRWMV